jgi:hypothetical protein
MPALSNDINAWVQFQAVDIRGTWLGPVRITVEDAQ